MKTRPIPRAIAEAQPAPIAMRDPGLRELLEHSERRAATLQHAIGRAPEYSLVQLIRSRLPGSFITDARAVERVHEVDALCRQMCGEGADGTWIPLEALAARRDLDTTSGANLIGTGYSGTLVPGVTPTHGLVGAVTTITGLRAGALTLPAIDSAVDASGGWSADGSGTTAEPTFKAARTVTPMHLNVNMTVARRLVQMTASADLEAELRAHLLRRVYDELDRVLTAGAGTTEPLGILNDDDVPTLAIGTDGGALTWAKLCDAEEAPALAVGEMVRPQWVMHPTLRKKLRQTTNPAGDLILPESRLLAAPVSVSNAMPVDLTKGSGTDLTGLIYGDAAEIILGMWGGGIDLIVDPFKYGTTGALHLIARVEVGVVVRRPGALVKFVDIDPS